MSTSKTSDQLNLFSRERLLEEPKPKLVTSTECTVCPQRYLADHEVAARFSTSRATIWRWVAKNQKFPKPIKLSPGTTRWRRSDLVSYEALASAASAERIGFKTIGELK